MSKKKKYDESYVQFGFDFVTNDGVEKPLCILCSKVLGNGSMKPSILIQNLQSNHPAHANDTIDSFKAKRARFRAGGTLPKLGFIPEQKPAVEAAYNVALHIAKQKKAHTIAETLVKPCALEMVRLMLGEDAQRRIQQIPLSNDTIQKRILDMSHDIREQVIEEILASSAKISLQLDESTDVANCSHLLVFCRYIHEGHLKGEFLMCEPLVTTTKAVDVLQKMETVFEQNQITWNNVGSLCTDGAPAMMEVRSGFTTLVKQRTPHALCEEPGSQYSVLLYHTEVRWLSRGHVLSRVFELRGEIEIFLRDRGSALSEEFQDSKFVVGLAYLSDIFAILNNLNLSLKGTTITILEVSEKLQALETKLELWATRVEKRNFATFPHLDGMSSDSDIPADLMKEIADHLRALKKNFKGYFSTGMASTTKWIVRPFLTNLVDVDDDDPGKDELIDLQASSTLRQKYEMETPEKFWGSLTKAFPLLSKRAFEVIVPFVTTYLCEAEFSALVTMKTKARSRLAPENDMRVALSTTSP